MGNATTDETGKPGEENIGTIIVNNLHSFGLQDLEGEIIKMK